MSRVRNNFRNLRSRVPKFPIGTLGSDKDGKFYANICSTPNDDIQSVFWEEGITAIATASRCRTRKKPTPLNREYSIETRRTLCSHLRAAFSKTMEFIKTVQKVFKTKQMPRAGEADVHRGFGDESDRYMLAGVW